MSASQTLAERFRTQRTDRIRVDGVEVLSMVDVVVDGFSALEVVVESARDDVPQVLCLRSRATDLRLVAGTLGTVDEATEVIQIEATEPSRSELHGDDGSNTVIQIWNCWRIGDNDHAWTGNSGIVVEDLPAPEGTVRRMRLWCSDGLGEASFDDLVVVLTIGARSDDDASI